MSGNMRDDPVIEEASNEEIKEKECKNEWRSNDKTAGDDDASIRKLERGKQITKLMQ